LDTKIRSAIYSQDFNCIIALPNLEDDEQPHIHFYGPKGELLGSMKFDFAKEMKSNYFRTYFITEYINSTSFIYGAFFQDDGAKEDNIGTPLIFTLNCPIDEKTKFEDIKGQEGAIQYYFNTDIEHNNDDDNDGGIPIVKPVWLHAPRSDANERVCLL
jgi:hypothetical protein